MLFYENLEEIIFSRHETHDCDELVILSGYVGPTPVHRLGTLPVKSTVIYGMYGSEGIQRKLHTALVSENQELEDVEVLYSTIPIHSKCYVWKKDGKVVHALVGSANFSVNGLTMPYKEVLAETTTDTFYPLNTYLNSILAKSISCEDAVFKENKRRSREEEDLPGAEYNRDICTVPLYVMEKGQFVVPKASGLNWGMASLNGSHVNINDAYFPIAKKLVRRYPALFPIKQTTPEDLPSTARKGHRHNDNIEIIWDDGTTMTGLLEGSQDIEIEGITGKYPKQISTTPNKSTLGMYMRERLGVKEGEFVTYDDLLAYGRTSVDISLMGEGIYYFDFSVKSE